jgi:hypothetical protein
MMPEYFWSNCVALTSIVKARFLSGVQITLPPSHVEVGIAVTGQAILRNNAGGDGRVADRVLGVIAVPNLSTRTIDRAGPVGIPAWVKPPRKPQVLTDSSEVPVAAVVPL